MVVICMYTSYYSDRFKNFGNWTNNVNRSQVNTFGNPLWTLQRSWIEIRFPLKDCHCRMTRPFKAHVSLVKANHVCSIGKQSRERDTESKPLAFYWSNLIQALILWYRIISDCNETTLTRLPGVSFETNPRTLIFYPQRFQ